MGVYVGDVIISQYFPKIWGTHRPMQANWASGWRKDGPVDNGRAL